MRPPFVVMRHPVSRDASQMGFGYRDKVVKAFAPECADHAFTEAVSFRACPWRIPIHAAIGV
jgi:hypothetical protein